MPAARTPMRQVHEILTMKHEAGLPVREIVRRTGDPAPDGSRAAGALRCARAWLADRAGGQRGRA
jgi:hypothetical protein